MTVPRAIDRGVDRPLCVAMIAPRGRSTPLTLSMAHRIESTDSRAGRCSRAGARAHHGHTGFLDGRACGHEEEQRRGCPPAEWGASCPWHAMLRIIEPHHAVEGRRSRSETLRLTHRMQNRAAMIDAALEKARDETGSLCACASLGLASNSDEAMTTFKRGRTEKPIPAASNGQARRTKAG